VIAAMGEICTYEKIKKSPYKQYITEKQVNACTLFKEDWE
jgi:hypothetical protein